MIVEVATSSEVAVRSTSKARNGRSPVRGRALFGIGLRLRTVTGNDRIAILHFGGRPFLYLQMLLTSRIFMEIESMQKCLLEGSYFYKRKHTSYISMFPMFSLST